MHNPSLKTEYSNIPVSVPTAWKEDLQRKADELGISRNSAFQMAVKFGAPILQAHIQLMRKTLKENCRRIAGGDKKFSKILGTPPFSVSVFNADHDRRKSKSRSA